ncbi:MAG TPA: hypothetical protein VE871_00510 [Longimicrobium sp.]|nr:hypothetical protein [Longimicrobium sp.]
MPPTSSAPPVLSLKEQLVRESCSMVRRLVTNGVRVPPSVIQATDDFETALEHRRPIDITALASTHERLSRLVAPAKPGTLYLLDPSFHQLGHKASSLGPVKLVRDLVRVAMVCVAVFIVLSVVTLVDAHAGIDLFDVERLPGEPVAGAEEIHSLLVLKLILQRVYWLAAAGIGAAFAMLFALNEQVTARTFDPDETPAYWVKFFLGVVAGFILVALVPVDSGSGTAGATNGTQALGPPTVAMLGGFSASAVYRILTRMVEALESVFTGGAREQAAAAEKAASTRAAEENSQARMALAGQLVDLQQQLAAGMPADRAATQLRQVVAALMPASAEFSTPEGAAQPGAPSAAAPSSTGPSADAAPDKVPALSIVAGPADAAPATEASASAEGGKPADAPAQAPAPAPAAVG